MRANNNNRKETVLEVFLPATERYGWPSRMRGDHGVENGSCADAMEEKRGPGRGSYIWGRLAHPDLISSRDSSNIFSGVYITVALKGSGWITRMVSSQNGNPFS